MVGIEGKIIADRYKNENGENRYITRVRANSFRFLDSRTKILILQQYKSLKQGIMIQNLYLIKSMKKENYLLKNYLFREGKYILTNFE